MRQTRLSRYSAPVCLIGASAATINMLQDMHFAVPWRCASTKD